MGTQRIAFLVGSALTAVLATIFLVATVWPLRRAPSDACIPSSDIPRLALNQLANHDGTFLAKMSGYLELLDAADGPKYLPLDLHTAIQDSQQPIVVRIAGDCMAIEIRAANQTSKDELYYTYERIDLLVHDNSRNNENSNLLAMKQAPVPRKICEFSPAFAFAQSKLLRYSCLQTRNHLCWPRQSTPKGRDARVNLVLARFEFEFETDPHEALEGEFCKKPMSGSCAKWL